MILYHLDRNKRLERGSTINLIPNHSLPPELKDSLFVQQLGGQLSPHGINYMNPICNREHYCVSDGRIFFSADSVFSQLNIADHRIMEYGLELIRQAYFSHYPSRLQCLYAVDSIDEFAHWSELQSETSDHIIEFEAPDNTPRFDSRWLKGGLCQDISPNGEYHFAYAPTLCFELAFKYWSGMPSQHPRWEYLVTLPITVHNVHNISHSPQTAPEVHQP